MDPERWTQIEKLYHAALELERSKRAAFLKEACGADHDLGREVDSLLASDAAAGSFIEAPAVEMAAKGLAKNPSILAMGKDSLKTGARISHYEILGKLGSGGMGEVYRARDTKLNRDVGLKILPQQFAGDPERLSRFRREAQVLASINHPNICTIHEVDEYAGQPFIAMELMEGQTLRESLRTGALPARKAVEYGIQAGRGLAAAHEKGIVHRDLKPENLFLTSDDRLKILDFGLARLVAAEGPAAERNDLPTATQATAAGIVMGTLGYMSPEQARGQTVDQRADIFALGAILYEMLSGASAFKRGSSADTMSAILKEDPPELPSDSKVPPALERIVRRCLEKQPNQRFQDASDVAFALEALSGTATHLADAAVQARFRWRQRLVPALALVAALAIGSLAGRRLFRSDAPQPKFTAVTFRRGTIYNARFSPDGNSIYYAAAWDGNPIDVYVTSRDDPGGAVARRFRRPSAGRLPKRRARDTDPCAVSLSPLLRRHIGSAPAEWR